jgi:hypothetical protein
MSGAPPGIVTLHVSVDRSNETHRWKGGTVLAICEACGVDSDDDAADLPCPKAGEPLPDEEEAG